MEERSLLYGKGERKDFNSAVADFVKEFDQLYRLGIRTSEELRNTKQYLRFFNAAYWLSDRMMNSPVFWGRLKTLKACTREETEDVVNDLAICIVDKFETIMKAYAGKAGLMNLKGYVSLIAHNLITDKLKKRVETVPIDPVASPETDSVALLERLRSEELTPEEHALTEETKDEAVSKVCDWMSGLAKHDSKAKLYGIVVGYLKEEGDPFTIEVLDNMGSVCKRPDDFIKVYNIQIMRYARSIGLPQSVVRQFYASSLKEFGRQFKEEYIDDFSSYISRQKYRGKEQLAGELGIDLGPKQVRRKGNGGR